METSPLRGARPVRLLYLVGQLGPGGRERQLWYLLSGLDRERYLPAVAVWSFRSDEVYAVRLAALGVPLLAVAPADASPLAKLAGLRRLVRDTRAEVLHCQSFFLNAPAWLATLSTRTRAIGTVASDFDADRRLAGPALGRLCAALPRFQIFNSRNAIDVAGRTRSPFVPGHARLVRNAVDLAAFHGCPAPVGGRAEILAVGSLYAYKRWDRLLAAAAQLAQRGLDFRVTLAGDGPARAELAALAQRLGLGERFRLVGYRDDVAQLLAGAALLAHTAEFEGCPNVVLEAMAAGRAVVASAVGDIPLLVEDGVHGFVLPRDDVDAFAEGLGRLIADRALCREMGTRARARAERDLSISRLVEETLSAYLEAGWSGA